MKRKILAYFILLTPILSFAESGTLGPPLSGMGTTLPDFIDWLIEIIQLVGTPVLIVCIIYAGYLFVTAGGNEEQVTKAKTWFVSTIIGVIIVAGAHVIAHVIQGTADLFK